MRFELMLAEKAHYPIPVMARVLAVTPSGYYADDVLRQRLRRLHAASRGTYGSPRLLRALRDTGTRVGRNRIIRVMRAERLHGRPRRRFRVTTQADPGATPATNHLARQFAVAGPNRVWAADVTALPTDQGWVYLAIMLDLWSRRVIGWALRPTLDTALVTAAWHMAVGRRQTVPQLHHSDCGSQYTSEAYQQRLQHHRVRCSMSR